MKRPSPKAVRLRPLSATATHASTDTHTQATSLHKSLNPCHQCCQQWTRQPSPAHTLGRTASSGSEAGLRLAV